MRKLYLLLLFFFGIVNCATAQDVIYLLSDDKISCKVDIVEPETITYTITDSVSEKQLSLPVNEIEKIVFENGYTEVFNKKENNIDKQDQIYFNNGNYERGIVLTIEEKEITYLTISGSDSLIYVADKSLIKKIIFKNGVVEEFEINVASNYSADELYLKGLEDGKKTYNATGEFLGTALTTMLFPPVGVISMLSSAVFPPNERKYDSPEPELLKDQNYKSGYRKGASRKKVINSLAGLGVGSVATVVFYGAVFYFTW
jgi:hypothetical protein